MKKFLELNGRQYWLANLEAPFAFDVPFGGRPFVCLLWDAGSQADIEAMVSVCSFLIESNCRYVVAGGAQCELWHDMVDEEICWRSVDNPGIEYPFVMTDWCTNEPVSEVAFFMVHCTDFDDHKFTDYLVLLLCGDSSAEYELMWAIEDELGVDSRFWVARNWRILFLVFVVVAIFFVWNRVAG